MAPASSVPADGHHVGVRRFGKLGGRPVVWCHGGLSSALDATFFDAAGRQRGAEVIAIDRPGIGRSDYRHLSHIGRWPHLVETVADSLGLDQFAVAGWSAGGPYALACAAMMPERVRAVATLAGMAPLEHISQAFELGLWADRVLIPAAQVSPVVAATLIRASRAAPDRYLAREVLRTAGRRDGAALSGKPLGWVVGAVREATVNGVRGTADDYRRIGRDWGFELGSVRQPTTVWQGDQDALVPAKHARRLANSLPSGTLRMVASAGHYLPALLADAVLHDLAPR
ncbi:alpha/beta hydrolase [Mycobacterium sp. PO1]|nr:alpha/beta hydrolase [Mycobacterium sp. PO1]GFM23062.1 Alpha/beta hydrolase [Mycobacterium sp. PO2]